jgi:hypothetical protein
MDGTRTRDPGVTGAFPARRETMPDAEVEGKVKATVSTAELTCASAS